MDLTVRHVADLLQVSEKTIYRWIRKGNLPAYRLNEQYRFHRAEILEWATSRKIPVSAGIFEEPAAAHCSHPGLGDALERGGIFYRLSGADKTSVLREAVSMMRLPDAVNREFLLNVLIAREELASTGVGDGIAFPHVRNPIVLHVTEPIVTLCFLENPVDFGALDGKPVDTLFTIVTPTVRTHLRLLAMLAHSIRDPEFMDAVRRKALREEILRAARKVEEAGLRDGRHS